MRYKDSVKIKDTANVHKINEHTVNWKIEIQNVSS